MIARSLPILLALAAALALVPTASAHDHVMIHGAEWTIGFATEPALVDEPNGVSVRVKGPVESGNMSANSTFAWTFATTGSLRYHCHFHPWQQGNVTIIEAQAGQKAKTWHVAITDGATPSAYRFAPENLVIRAGDTVVWHNNGTMVHTVSPGEPSAHGHGGHQHGGHDHGHDAAMFPVLGLEKTMKVTVSTGGKSKELALEKVFRDPGHYVARFIPTAPGVYTFQFKGTAGGKAVDHTLRYEAEPVKARGDMEFPSKGISSADTLKRIDDLAKSHGDSHNNAPGPEALLVVGAVAAASVLVAIRRRG